MKKTLKIKIQKGITEQTIIENCLMRFHSGYDYKFLLFIYGMNQSWKFDKLIYYINLIEESH